MGKRILYVEDNPRNMLLVKRIIEAEGHELLSAVDGEMGWTTAVTHHPDLILMDLRLPGDISGFELTRRLKQHPELRHVPIVALTAYGNEEAETRARAAGCDAFLAKPADIRQIRATLHQFFTPEPAQNGVTAVPHFAFI
jgi:two-component system, cell cycle response regulator DivK